MLVLVMIKSWKHKGLKNFFLTGSHAGINSQHAKKIGFILQLLNASSHPEQMDMPGYDFHRLHGDLKGYFSVAVRANWKIIFQFEGEDAILVDYLDYH